MKQTFSLIVAGGLLAAGCSGSGGSGGSGSDTLTSRLAPVISAIADQTGKANVTGTAIGFDVSDDRTLASALTVLAMSSDQRIVADNGIVVSRVGAHRTLTITPLSDVTGTTQISVVTTDEDSLSATASFRLTIQPESRSISEFARASFTQSEDGQPQPINAVVFVQDAEMDDFTDLLNN